MKLQLFVTCNSILNTFPRKQTLQVLYTFEFLQRFVYYYFLNLGDFLCPSLKSWIWGCQIYLFQKAFRKIFLMWSVQDNSGLNKCDPSVPYSCLDRSSCLQLCPSCPQRLVKVPLDTLNVFEWIFSVITNWNDSCLLLMTFRAGAHRRTSFFIFQTIMCLIILHQKGSLWHGKYFPVLEGRWWARWSV